MHAGRPVYRCPRDRVWSNAALNPIHERQQEVMRALIVGTVRAPKLAECPSPRASRAVLHTGNEEQAVEVIQRQHHERSRN